MVLGGGGDFFSAAVSFLSGYAHQSEEDSGK